MMSMSLIIIFVTFRGEREREVLMYTQEGSSQSKKIHSFIISPLSSSCSLDSFITINRRLRFKSWLRLLLLFSGVVVVFLENHWYHGMFCYHPHHNEWYVHDVRFGGGGMRRGGDEYE